MLNRKFCLALPKSRKKYRHLLLARNAFSQRLWPATSDHQRRTFSTTPVQDTTRTTPRDPKKKRAKDDDNNKPTGGMSWMDSWSRPAKSQATPAPYYLLPGGEATSYCHSCGRVIGTRRQINAQQHDKNKTAVSEPVVKYCSSRCRNRKPGKLDREIEDTFLRLLLGKKKEEEAAGEPSEGAAVAAAEKHASAHGGKGSKQRQKNKKVKGDARILVSCSMVEDEMFPQHHDDASATAERPGTSSSNSSQDGAPLTNQRQTYEDDDDDNPPSNAQTLHDDLDAPEALHPPHHSDDEVDGDVLARLSVRSGTRIRPPQSVSQVNGSVGGEKGRAERLDESAELLQKRMAGQRRAREWEMVKCAARRGVAFGFAVGEDEGDVPNGGGEQHGGSTKGKRGKKGGKKSSLEADGNHDGGEEKDGTGRRRYCEAVMNGKVVEPSFAKGNWGIRWREE